MQALPWVSDASSLLARSWEQRFCDLPAVAGVIFVGVRPRPSEDGSCRTYEVRLGVSRDIEEATGIALIKHVLAEEIDSGLYEIQGIAVRGVSGSAHRSAVGEDPS